MADRLPLIPEKEANLEKLITDLIRQIILLRTELRRPTVYDVPQTPPVQPWQYPYWPYQPYPVVTSEAAPNVVQSRGDDVYNAPGYDRGAAGNGPSRWEDK